MEYEERSGLLKLGGRKTKGQHIHPRHRNTLGQDDRIQKCRLGYSTEKVLGLGHKKNSSRTRKRDDERETERGKRRAGRR